jgi:hypothetical protein
MVNARVDIGIGIGPGACLIERLEHGDHDAAGETGRTRVLGIDRRAWPGKQQLPRIAEGAQPVQVRGPHRRPGGEDVRAVVPLDRIPHALRAPDPVMSSRVEA